MAEEQPKKGAGPKIKVFHLNLKKNRHKEHLIQFSPCILIPSPSYIILQNE